MKKILLLFLALICFIKEVNAEDNLLAQNAKSVILIEASTGEILYEYNAHEKLAPASMTKMMSLILIMEALDNGVIKYDDMITASS